MDHRYDLILARDDLKVAGRVLDLVQGPADVPCVSAELHDKLVAAVQPLGGAGLDMEQVDRMALEFKTKKSCISCQNESWTMWDYLSVK